MWVVYWWAGQSKGSFEAMKEELRWRSGAEGELGAPNRRFEIGM